MLYLPASHVIFVTLDSLVMAGEKSDLILYWDTPHLTLASPCLIVLWCTNEIHIGQVTFCNSLHA